MSSTSPSAASTGSPHFTIPSQDIWNAGQWPLLHDLQCAGTSLEVKCRLQVWYYQKYVTHALYSLLSCLHRQPTPDDPPRWHSKCKTVATLSWPAVCVSLLGGHVQTSGLILPKILQQCPAHPPQLPPQAAPSCQFNQVQVAPLWVQCSRGPESSRYAFLLLNTPQLPNQYVHNF